MRSILSPLHVPLNVSTDYLGLGVGLQHAIASHSLTYHSLSHSISQTLLILITVRDRGLADILDWQKDLPSGTHVRVGRLATPRGEAMVFFKTGFVQQMCRKKCVLTTTG